MVRAEPIGPWRMYLRHPGAKIRPAFEFNAVPLPIVKPDRLDRVEALERPGEACRAILSAGKENQSAVPPVHADAS